MTASRNERNPDWVLIFTSDRLTEIEAAIALLEENAIPSFKINKKDSTYIFGEVELYVPDHLADQSRLLLTENDLL